MYPGKNWNWILITMFQCIYWLKLYLFQSVRLQIVSTIYTFHPKLICSWDPCSTSKWNNIYSIAVQYIFGDQENISWFSFSHFCSSYISRFNLTIFVDSFGIIWWCRENCCLLATRYIKMGLIFTKLDYAGRN